MLDLSREISKDKPKDEKISLSIGLIRTSLNFQKMKKRFKFYLNIFQLKGNIINIVIEYQSHLPFTKGY